MKYLTKKEIIKIHQEIEKIYGIDSTILQPSNLDIVIDVPKRKFFGVDIYQTVSEKGAALMWNLLKLHPFVDGNNRTGLSATSMFLERNGRELTSSRNIEVNACRETSKCTWQLDMLTEWVRNNSRRKR